MPRVLCAPMSGMVSCADDVGCADDVNGPACWVDLAQDSEQTSRVSECCTSLQKVGEHLSSEESWAWCGDTGRPLMLCPVSFERVGYIRVKELNERVPPTSPVCRLSLH